MFPFELFVSNLFSNGSLVPWDAFKNEHNLQNRDFFKWRQLVSAIPQEWKNMIADNPHVHMTSPPIQNILQLTREIPLNKLEEFLW